MSCPDGPLLQHLPTLSLELRLLLIRITVWLYYHRCHARQEPNLMAARTLWQKVSWF
jgi:hypothetical protein